MLIRNLRTNGCTYFSERHGTCYCAHAPFLDSYPQSRPQSPHLFWSAPRTNSLAKTDLKVCDSLTYGRFSSNLIGRQSKVSTLHTLINRTRQESAFLVLNKREASSENKIVSPSSLNFILRFEVFRSSRELGARASTQRRFR